MMDTSLVSELRRIYGPGENPKARYRLFWKLGRMVCQGNGEAIRKIIGEVQSESKGKRSPARWFAAVVLWRIREAGLAPFPDVETGVGTILADVGSMPDDQDCGRQNAPARRLTT